MPRIGETKRSNQRAVKRRQFFDEAAWTITDKGSAWRDWNAVRVTVFSDKYAPEFWRFCIGKADHRPYFSRRFRSRHEAVAGAFEWLNGGHGA